MLPWLSVQATEHLVLPAVRSHLLALMTDNGTPFVAIVRQMMSRFQRTLAELDIRHIRTQIDTPWTNGKIEAF